MTSKRLAKSYDFVVIDPGFTGILLSHILVQKGKNVLFVQTRNALGQQQNYIETSHGRLHGHLSYLPNNDVSSEALKWLKEMVGEETIENTVELQALTVDSGKLSPFSGFGEQKFNSINELSKYNTVENLKLSEQPEKWIEDLSTSLTCDQLHDYELTEVIISENKVESIILNGSKKVNAEHFIYGDSLKNLMDIIPVDHVSGKVRSKIAKLRPLSRVSLHCNHKEILNNSNDFHFLMGSKTDFEPVVGQFFSPNPDGTQDSMWFSLVTGEQVEDAEYLGSVLKNMKRQIKRAYEDFFDTLNTEKLIIQNESNGEFDLNFKTPFLLGGLDNFYLSHKLLSDQVGLVGQISVAKDFQEQVLM